MALHIEACPDCRDFLERQVRGGLEPLAREEASFTRPDGVPRIDGFVIERELGRGAMGVVYLARREAPRRQVALKLLPGGRRAGPRERRQWLREAEAASQVRHPGVVTLYEAGESEDWFLLVLEYIPGGTLADRLVGPLSPRNAAGWMEAIARAVHYIHQCGQLHLDLKPSNILLDGEAGGGWEGVTPKVSDFGIARPVEPGVTETGGPGPGGTPSYMAPEQITQARREMTPAADIHGLGAILYHMLTGRPPYQGATILETIDLVQRHEPIPPRRLNPRIPADLETICLKCLEKSPARRYPSAGPLAEDLSRWLAGRTISARPASAAEKAWRWCRRRPVVAALASILALTLSVGFVVVTLLWRRAEADRLRAEANLRMSNEIMADLVDLTTGGRGSAPKVITLDVLLPLLDRDRKRLITLAAALPDDLPVRRQLALVESRFSASLMQAGRHAEARAVLLESLARLEALTRRYPGDSALLDYLCHNLCLIAEVSESLHSRGESLQYLERSVRLCEEVIAHHRSIHWTVQLIGSRRALAWCCLRCGDRQRAAPLFAANSRLLDELPAEVEGISLSVERWKAHIDSGLFANASTGKRADQGPDATEAASRPKLPTDALQPAQEWARLAAQVLRSGDHAYPADARRVSEDALDLMTHLTEVASTFRRLGDLEAARRIVERMLALGAHLVESYPRQPAAHLAVSYSYIQIYKLSWASEDRAGVRANMELALASARNALKLDSSCVNAQQAVDSLQRKLAALDGE
jgi:tetratricopeptide (TPR) repeat protein